MEKGLVQVYYGDGKGKTTAALGAAIRALGAGLKVHLVQIMKPSDSGEIKALPKFPNFSYKNFETGWVKGNPTKEQKDKALRCLDYLKSCFSVDNKYDIIIADEILYAVQFALLSEEEVVELINQKPESVELILTGSHRSFPKIFALADLITEMKKVKHPFDVGVKARKGIEY
jgi:cob(I)alamin adenosyltransferase